MMEFIMDILNGAENAAIIVGLIIGVNLVKKAVEYGKENTDNEKVKRWLGEIDTAFEKAVKAVNQTLVDALKYNDAFDDAAQEAARKEAKKVFLQVLGDEARVYLSNAYANVDAFIATGIEAAVADAKKDKPMMIEEIVVAEETE